MWAKSRLASSAPFPINCCFYRVSQFPQPSAFPPPPGLLAAFRQNTSVATSEHVLVLPLQWCAGTAWISWHMSKLWYTYARVLPWCTACNRKTRQFLQCISYPYYGHTQHRKHLTWVLGDYIKRTPRCHSNPWWKDLLLHETCPSPAEQNAGLQLEAK